MEKSRRPGVPQPLIAVVTSLERAEPLSERYRLP